MHHNHIIHLSTINLKKQLCFNSFRRGNKILQRKSAYNIHYTYDDSSLMKYRGTEMSVCAYDCRTSAYSFPYLYVNRRILAQFLWCSRASKSGMIILRRYSTNGTVTKQCGRLVGYSKPLYYWSWHRSAAIDLHHIGIVSIAFLLHSNRIAISEHSSQCCGHHITGDSIHKVVGSLSGCNPIVHGFQPSFSKEFSRTVKTYSMFIRSWRDIYSHRGDGSSFECSFANNLIFS